MVIIFWSSERGQDDRIKDKKPKNGEWIVSLKEDRDNWIDTFNSRKMAVNFCRKNNLDFCFLDGIL